MATTQKIVSDHGIGCQGLAHLPSGKRLQGAGDARHRSAMCTGVHEQTDNTADSVPCDRLQKIVCLVGPTAVGKTALSLEIAHAFSCEIVSVDSMQVYRYMDIGTAKPTPEEQRQVRHHCIDLVDPATAYNTACFVRNAEQAVAEIRGRGCLPLFTGGTGLYMKAFKEGLFELPVKIPGTIRKKLCQEMDGVGSAAMHARLAVVDPASSTRIHPNDSQRILRGLEIYEASGTPWSHWIKKQKNTDKQRVKNDILTIGLHIDREILGKRIEMRTRQMIDHGFIQEVKDLLAKGYPLTLSSMQSIGYRHVGQYLTGRVSLQDALAAMATDTKRYAKRQFTWFQRDKDIIWIEHKKKELIFDCIASFLKTT